jgi:hypothetical protein
LITGLWTADDEGVNIYINGTPTGSTTSSNGYGALASSFAITSGFVNGTNTIEFVVQNDKQTYWLGVNYGNPTGLRVEMSGTAATVPVPAAILLFAPGLLGLLGLRRKLSK